MAGFIPINSLSTNENITHKFDEFETVLNLLSCEINSVHPKKKLLENLKYLLKIIHEKEFRDQKLKEGLLYKLLGDYYLTAGQPYAARSSFEKAQSILSSYPSLSFLHLEAIDEEKIKSFSEHQALNPVKKSWFKRWRK